MTDSNKALYQAEPQKDFTLKKSDGVYHMHHLEGNTTVHEDIKGSNLKEKVQDFHPGHEKDIPEKKDMMDPAKFEKISGQVDKHVAQQLKNREIEEHHDVGILEKAKELLIEAKDAIVDGASHLVDGAKKMFSSNNSTTTEVSNSTQQCNEMNNNSK
jgi:hypothetical protein